MIISEMLLVVILLIRLSTHVKTTATTTTTTLVDTNDNNCRVNRTETHVVACSGNVEQGCGNTTYTVNFVECYPSSSCQPKAITERTPSSCGGNTSTCFNYTVVIKTCNRPSNRTSIPTIPSISTVLSAQDYLSSSTTQPSSLTNDSPILLSTPVASVISELPTTAVFPSFVLTSMLTSPKPTLSLVATFQGSKITTLLQHSTLNSVIKSSMFLSELTNQQSISISSNLKASLPMSTRLKITPTTSVEIYQSSITLPLYSIKVFSTMEPCWITTFIAYNNQTISHSLSDVKDFSTTNHIIQEQRTSILPPVVVNPTTKLKKFTTLLSKSSNTEPELQTSFQNNIHLLSTIQSPMNIHGISTITSGQAIGETTNIDFTKSIISLLTQSIESNIFSQQSVAPSITTIIPSSEIMNNHLKRDLNDQTNLVTTGLSMTSINSASIVIKSSYPWTTEYRQLSSVAGIQTSIQSAYVKSDTSSTTYKLDFIESISSVNVAQHTNILDFSSLSTAISQNPQPILSTSSESDITKISFTPTLNTILPFSISPSMQYNVTSAIMLVHPSRSLSTSSGYYTSILDSCLRIYSTIVLLSFSSTVNIMSKFSSFGNLSSTANIFPNPLLIPTPIQPAVSNVNSAIHAITSITQSTVPVIPSIQLSPTPSLLVIVSTSVVINSTVSPPTTTVPTSNLLEITLKNVTVNENDDGFKSSIEQKLVNTYVAAKQLEEGKRKRRAATSGTSEVQVFRMVRSKDDVSVEFSVKENGRFVPAKQAETTYNILSPAGLQSRIGYGVTSPVSIVFPFTSDDLVAIVLEDSAANNMSLTANQEIFMNKMALYYMTENKLNTSISVKIITENITHEIGGIVYVEFYIIVDSESQQADQVVKFFQTTTTDKLSSAINPLKALILPYPAYKHVDTNRENYVRMKIKLPMNSNTKLTSFQTQLEQKISTVYLTGKQTKSLRKRREAGSVQSKIIALYDTDPLEIIFVIIDGGQAIIGSEAAVIMNNVTPLSAMQTILGAEVILAPEAVVLPSTTASTDDNVKYWIIGIVCGIVVLLSVIGVLVCWRWIRGGPPKTGVPVDQVEIVEDETDAPALPSKETPVEEAESAEIVDVTNKDVVKAPLFSRNKHPNDYTSDDLIMSQRPKVHRGSLKPKTYVGSKNLAYDPSIEEDDDESVDEEDDDDDDDHDDKEEKPPSRSRQLTPPQPVPRRRLEHDTSQPIYRQRAERSPKLPSRSENDVYGRRPFEMTGNVMRADTQNTSYTADQIPTFSQVNEKKEYTATNPPIRFRTNMQNIESYSRPTGPLPLLNLKQTSILNSTPVFKPPLDPDIEHKTEIERMRNKQRQRDQAFSGSRNPATSQSGRMNDSWRREQEKINSILDPLATDLPQRKGRLRRKMRRKNKISIAPNASGGLSTDSWSKNSDNVVLKSFKRKPGDRSSDRFTGDDEESDAESQISMEEARLRIQDMLDDAFHSMKKYKQKFGDGNTTVELSPTKVLQQSAKSSSLPRKHRDSQPVLAHPLPVDKARTGTFPTETGNPLIPAPNPYSMPYVQYPVGYPDPLVTWDPLERQRYMDQRMGYPAYGPVVGSLPTPYGKPKQNVYVTPVHQRPDGAGGMMWNPYAMNQNLPPPAAFQLGTMPGESNARMSNIDYMKETAAATPHSTTIDINDVGTLSKDTSQPLIRAIKEELLRLSHSAQGKTKIQDFRPTMTS